MKTSDFEMPVTSAIRDLFLRYGVNPYQNQKLVTDLMRFVYDHTDEALTQGGAHEAE
jgi:hypothetical protein